MLQIYVEIENLNDPTEFYAIQLPCDLKHYMKRDQDYIIVYNRSNVKLGPNDDIEAINEALALIASESPNMTEEYLSVLCEANGNMPITNRDFLQQIMDNDFYFTQIKEDISQYYYLPEEKAVCHLLVNCRIPFCENMDFPSSYKEVLPLIKKLMGPATTMHKIWEIYEANNFQLITPADTYINSNDYIVNMQRAII